MQDAIKQYAFFKSNYPLILSIENHCSIEYQDKMAHHLETILGDMLYKEPVDENLTQLPSPEDLKGKILIKAKKLPPGEACLIINVAIKLISNQYKMMLCYELFEQV